MNNYPDIKGLHFGMTIDEVIRLVQDLGYGSLILRSEDATKGAWYYVKRKEQEIEALSFVFVDNILTQFNIRDWRDFFSFTNSDMTFINLTEIFHGYFLKRCKYVRDLDGIIGIYSYFNLYWVIYFDVQDEDITMMKVS